MGLPLHKRQSESRGARYRSRVRLRAVGAGEAVLDRQCVDRADGADQVDAVGGSAQVCETGTCDTGVK